MFLVDREKFFLGLIPTRCNESLGYFVDCMWMSSNEIHWIFFLRMPNYMRLARVQFLVYAFFVIGNYGFDL